MSAQPPRIIFNDDAATILCGAPPPYDKASVHAAVDYLKDTPVDVLCFLLGEQSCAYSYLSDRVESCVGKSLELMGQRRATDAVETVGFREQENLALNLYARGVDFVPILIDRTHEHGMQFFGSFRMNDSHLRSDPRGLLSPAFWQQHQEYRLWSNTASRHYYSAGLDYAYPEVRANYFAMIEEVAQKYDVDGIELDFGRNPYLFQVGEGWGNRQIMTDFIGSLRQMLDAEGARKGKRISLLLRTVFNDDLRTDMGMDVEEYLRAGYLDFLVMTNWSSSTTNNANTLLEPWLSRCAEHGVPFYPSVECTPAVNNAENVLAMVQNPHIPDRQGTRYPPSEGVQTPEEAQKQQSCLLAQAQNYHGQGAPGVYMFNIALHFANLRAGEATLRANPQHMYWLEQLRLMGDPAALAQHEKRYLFWPECPICVDSGRPMQYHQTITFHLFDPRVQQPDGQAVISFRQVAEKHPHASEEFEQDPIVPPGWVVYYLNGEPVAEACVARSLRPAGRIPAQFPLTAHELITLTVPTSRLRCGANTIAFHIPRDPEAHDPYVYIHDLTVDV